MTMPLEEWTKLDEAERTFAEYAALEADRWRPPSTGYMAAEAAMFRLFMQHRRALVDGVRPKCGQCKGSGSWPRLTRQLCPACDGDGWAR